MYVLYNTYILVELCVTWSGILQQSYTKHRHTIIQVYINITYYTVYCIGILYTHTHEFYVGLYINIRVIEMTHIIHIFVNCMYIYIFIMNYTDIQLYDICTEGPKWLGIYTVFCLSLQYYAYYTYYTVVTYYIYIDRYYTVYIVHCTIHISYINVIAYIMNICNVYLP